MKLAATAKNPDLPNWTMHKVYFFFVKEPGGFFERMSIIRDVKPVCITLLRAEQVIDLKRIFYRLSHYLIGIEDLYGRAQVVFNIFPDQGIMGTSQQQCFYGFKNRIT